MAGGIFDKNPILKPKAMRVVAERRFDDAEAMLTQMPELEAALVRRGERDGTDYAEDLKKICATWTVYARYSPRTILMNEAAAMLDRVRLLKEVLK